MGKAFTFRRFGSWAVKLLTFLGATLAPFTSSAAKWYPLGPFGGDARTIAADPADSRHLYLGTEIGWLYDSHDGGATWARVSQIAKRDDLVLDHILVDTQNPKRLIVGTWRVGATDGGVYISEDSGKNWYAQAEMKRQSVRSMARSSTDPRIIIAGTLQGIYQSDDNGIHWRLISPPESKEIHEVESLAIDPADPKIIYAGTWHLPWKTVDGGENWTNIKQGIIDDSDVFSIIIDPKDPKIVYLSACSGIYKSTDAAEQFHKIQGIPSTARRTRKLLQDPTDLNTVYAGTTEGLYKTADAGRTFSRMTDPDVIVNDVYVDPQTPNHVLIATDRGGVLSSEDGGSTFNASNTGFSARQVSSFASDPHNPSRIYVGVVNGKQTGGVFASSDGGLKWQQQSSGLRGQDVFSLAETSAGTLLAGTGHGIYRFENDAWTESSDLQVEAPAETPTRPRVADPVKRPSRQKASPTIRTHTATRRRQPASYVRAFPYSRLLLVRTSAPAKPRRKPLVKRTATRRSPLRQDAPRQERKPVHNAAPAAQPKAAVLDSVIYALQASGDAVFAGTDHGLLRSTADGHAWAQIPDVGLQDARFLAMHQEVMFAASLREGALSLDGGNSWKQIAPPDGLTQISAVAVDDSGALWIGGIEGVFFSADRGATWQTLRQLFLRFVNGIYSDPAEHRVYVASSSSTYAFVVHVPDRKVTYADTGWPLRFVRPVGDHLVAATVFEGTVVQPVMMDTPFSSAEKQ